MRSIRINNPGIFTSIQDTGRKGYRQFGMPVSGAMDIYSMKCANWLVGNDPNEAVLEATVIGPEIEFDSNVIFAITGASLDPRLNGQTINNWTTQKAKGGDILKLGYPVTGARAYIAISGGFRINETMGSLSTYKKARIGGINGCELKKGDEIQLYPSVTLLKKSRSLPEEMIPVYKSEEVLRVMSGVNYESFPKESLAAFVSEKYILSSNCDRMGYRLDGTVLKHQGEADVLSYGIHFGSIQVPGDGLPIIMAADSQTTGGYKQIANVITADLKLMAQLKPGDGVLFKMVDLAEAELALRDQEDKLNGLFGRSAGTVCIDCMKERF